MQRGFSLVEVLAGLVVLSIVVTTSLGVMFDRERRIREAEAMTLAYQAMANETEILRRIPWSQLETRHGKPFASDLALLARLDQATTLLEVASPKPRVKEITLSVAWSGGTKRARLSVLRTDTGGDNLW